MHQLLIFIFHLLFIYSQTKPGRGGHSYMQIQSQYTVQKTNFIVGLRSVLSFVFSLPITVNNSVFSFHCSQKNTMQFHYIVSDQTGKHNALTSLHKYFRLSLHKLSLSHGHHTRHTLIPPLLLCCLQIKVTSE